MSPWEYALAALCAASIHRLWIYEDIFAGPRGWAEKFLEPGLRKALLCAPCFAFWAAVMATAVATLAQVWAPAQVLFVILAMYFPLRLLTFWYRVPDDVSPTPQSGERMSSSLQQHVAEEWRKASPEKKECKSCGTEKKKSAEKIKALNNPSFVLASPLTEMTDSYSLCTVMVAQARAAVQAGMTVFLIVQEDFSFATLPKDWSGDPRYIVVPALPQFAWEEDTVNEEEAGKITSFFRSFLEQRGSGTLVTHDMLFQSWFTTHAKALHDLGDVEGWDIYHTAHSVPSPGSCMENFRCTVPVGHKLISLAHSTVPKLSSYYKASTGDIVTLPNAFDVLDWVSADDSVRSFCASTGLLDKDIVQTFPLSLPRMVAKGIMELLHIFGELKHQGRSVLLIIADAHGSEEAKARVRESLESNGLQESDIAFTSDHFPSGHAGLPRKQLHTLFELSDVFIFPSKSEACPLAVIEAAYCRNLLVLNSNLDVLQELVGGASCVWFGFGSVDKTPKALNVQDVARSIIKRLDNDSSQRARRRVHSRVKLSHIAGLIPYLNTLEATHKSLARRVNAGTVEMPDE